MDIMRVRPWFGKIFVSQKEADRVREMLSSAPSPDRTELEKEAKEYLEIVKKRHSLSKENDNKSK